MTGKFTARVHRRKLNDSCELDHSRFSQDENELLQRLCEFLKETAADFGIANVEITAFEMIDPEGDPDRIVVVQTLPVDADTALAYWDVEANRYSSWRKSLSVNERNLADDRFAINIQWTVDD